MVKEKLNGTDIKSLMDMMDDKDSTTRQKARKSSVTLGKSSVTSLTRALQNSKLDHLRWEAVKTLEMIGDVRAIPSLVNSNYNIISGYWRRFFSVLISADQAIDILSAQILSSFQLPP